MPMSALVTRTMPNSASRYSPVARTTTSSVPRIALKRVKTLALTMSATVRRVSSVTTLTNPWRCRSSTSARVSPRSGSAPDGTGAALDAGSAATSRDDEASSIPGAYGGDGRPGLVLLAGPPAASLSSGHRLARLRRRGTGMFVQIIEGRTKDGKALMAHGDTWEQRGRGGRRRVPRGDGWRHRGRPSDLDRALRVGGGRPCQQRAARARAWWTEMAKHYDGEPTFTESSDVSEFMGGGSDDAGFVQVMKSKGVDRATVEKMDELFEQYTDLRPDLLGGVRIWTGKDSCVDVAYFTSEAEARGARRPRCRRSCRRRWPAWQAAWARPSTSTSRNRTCAEPDEVLGIMLSVSVTL